MKLILIILSILILSSCKEAVEEPKKELETDKNAFQEKVVPQSDTAVSFQILPEHNEEVQDAANNIWRKYSIKSGIIEYEMSGMEGFENLFWDNYGALEARYHVSKRVVGEQVREKEMLLIYNDSLFYSINLKEKKGTLRNMDEHLDIKSNMKSLSKNLLKEIGAVEIGKGKVLNRNCVKWKLQDGVIMWIYKEFPLKIEFGQVVVKAKVFHENAKISADKFIVPDGIAISRE